MSVLGSNDATPDNSPIHYKRDLFQMQFIVSGAVEPSGIILRKESLPFVHSFSAAFVCDQAKTLCLGLVVWDTYDVIDFILCIIYVRQIFCFWNEHDEQKTFRVSFRRCFDTSAYDFHFSDSLSVIAS